MMADSRQRPAMGQEAGFRQLHFLVGSSVCTDGVISEEDAESAGMVTALSGSITMGGPPVASLASDSLVGSVAGTIAGSVAGVFRLLSSFRLCFEMMDDMLGEQL